MINRTITLRLMFVALAGTALLGVSAVLSSDEEVLWQMFGTAVSVAVACGLLTCWSLLGSLQAFRSAASMLSIVTFIDFLLVNALIWNDPFDLDFFKLLVTLAVINYHVPLGFIALRLTRFDWGRSAGWTGLGATAAATLFICLGAWSQGSRFEELLAVAGLAMGISGWLAAMVLLEPHGRHAARFSLPRVTGVLFAATFCITWIIINTTLALRSSWAPDPLLMDTATAVGAMAIGTSVSGLLQSLAMPVTAAWLRRSTLICTWAALLVIATQVIRASYLQNDPSFDLMLRISISTSIISLCGIVACLCLTAISTALRRARTGSGLLRFNCPVCHFKQTIQPGEHACPQCQSIVHFDYEVTRCQACRYPRKGWTSDACPECGWLIGTQPSTPG